MFAIVWLFADVGELIVVAVLACLAVGAVLYLSLRKTQAGITAADEGLKELLGKEGVAQTPLRPSGTAVFGERRVDVVSECDLIERGTRIRVVKVEGSRVVVRAEGM